jgi:hypothetical protein
MLTKLLVETQNPHEKNIYYYHKATRYGITPPIHPNGM